MARARARARGGRRSRRSASPCSRSSSSDRQSRTSAAARRACKPSARSCDGASAPRSCVVGETWSRSSAGMHSARTIVCSSRRARFASMSWPQNARSSACATFGTRTGRSPRSSRDARPSNGSSRTRRRKSEWSSSSASSQRMRSAAAAEPARIVTVPSDDCHARASSARPSTASACVSRPSRNVRVASLASRAESASEYGPRGATASSRLKSRGLTLGAGLLRRRPHAELGRAVEHVESRRSLDPRREAGAPTRGMRSRPAPPCLRLRAGRRPRGSLVASSLLAGERQRLGERRERASPRSPARRRVDRERLACELDRDVGVSPRIDATARAQDLHFDDVLVRRADAEAAARRGRGGCPTGPASSSRVEDDPRREDMRACEDERVLGRLEQRDRLADVLQARPTPGLRRAASRASDQYRRTRMYGSSVSPIRSSAVLTTSSARAMSPTSVSA